MSHRLLRYFRYDHLPAGPLRSTSMAYCELANVTATDPACTDPAEQTVALRKLLEAKDAAVRSVIPVAEPTSPSRSG